MVGQIVASGDRAKHRLNGVPRPFRRGQNWWHSGVYIKWEKIRRRHNTCSHWMRSFFPERGLRMTTDYLSKAKVLIVDDEPANVRLLERILAMAGCTHVATTTDSRQALALFLESEPDI